MCGNVVSECDGRGLVPCDGIMAVERCVGCFVILACSRDVWEKFSSGTSLNKQCLSAYSK